MRLDLQSVTRHVQDVDETVFVGHGHRGTVGTEFFSDGFGLRWRYTDGIGDLKIEGEILHIARIVL